MMRVLNGAVSAVTKMVSTLIRLLAGQTSDGVKTTYAQTVTGATTCTDAQEPSPPVATEPKAKRSRARSTTAEASPKRGRTSAQRTAIQPGQQQQTTVSKTPQPAKRGRKPKAKAAQ